MVDNALIDPQNPCMASNLDSSRSSASLLDSSANLLDSSANLADVPVQSLYPLVNNHATSSGAHVVPDINESAAKQRKNKKNEQIAKQIKKIGDLREDRILDEQNRKEVVERRLHLDPDIFCGISDTTITVGAEINNLVHHEAELPKLLEPTSDVLVIESNWITKIYPGYAIPTKEKTNNRGRKPKKKEPPNRKVSGTGKCMNSQVSFTILCRREVHKKELVGNIIRVPSSAKVYKIKLFRNGPIQIPGVTDPAHFDDVEGCIKLLINFLESSLNIAKGTIQHVGMNIVMRNFKFRANMSEYQIIRFPALKNVLERYKGMKSPIISDIGSCDDPRFSIIFSTPLVNNPDKEVCITMFPRGKIGILGGLNIEPLEKICEFLTDVFRKHHSEFIVFDGGYKYKSTDRFDNVPEPDEDEMREITRMKYECFLLS